MAKTKIPGPLERRHQLERELDPVQARKVADAYLEAGRETEAIPFLVMADASDVLDEMCGRAIEQGDGFLLKAASAALDRSASRADWERLGAAAAAAGKDRYVAMAERSADAVDA